MPQFGPDDRAVFEARATELYEIVVASGGIKADDPRVAGDADSKAAFELLVRLNLLTVEGDDQVWQAVDPATVQSQVVTPMGARGAELPQIQEWFEKFGDQLPAVLWTELDGLKARLGA